MSEKMENQNSGFRCGFVGIVGPTNSGKSTLLNQLVGKKVSIVSRLPQTTQRVVRGVLTRKESQLIFVDTPGLTQRRETFTRYLNQVTDKHAKDCDLLVWVFDASAVSVEFQIKKLLPLIGRLKKAEFQFAVLNKIDRVAKPKLLPLLQLLAESKLFSELIPLSARTGDGASLLADLLHQRLPVGPALYPEAQHTDRSEAFQISEMVREKIYETARQEIPYCAWVEVEHWDSATRVPTIYVSIHVDAPNRKAIMIGKNGQHLKEVGIRARKDIEALLGYQVCLKLRANLDVDWKNDARSLTRYLELE